MAIVFDPGTGGGSPWIYSYYTSTDGSTTKTGVTDGSYDANGSDLLRSEEPTTNIGPIFEPYEPELANLFAMEF
jgi:hypothetical protein